MARVSFKPPQLRYKESRESFKKRVEDWERSSGKSFKKSGPNNAEGLKILSGGGSLRIGNKDFSTDADWKDELKEIGTYRASQGRSKKQQLQDKEEFQKNIEYETERQRENVDPTKFKLGKVRDQAQIDAVHMKDQERRIQGMSKADRRAYDNQMLERQYGLEVGSLSGPPKQVQQGGKLESQAAGFLQRDREAQTEANNQIVRGNNNVYNTAQTPRTAGKWSGNVHSSARNSVLANRMRIKEQFQGQGANMGYRQAEQAAKQQADAATQGAQKVAQSGKQGTPQNQPGTQPPEVQKTPQQKPVEQTPEPPKLDTIISGKAGTRTSGVGPWADSGETKGAYDEALKTGKAGKAGGAKGGPGAMATAQTALKIAQLLMPKKKQEASFAKAGAGPGSTGMDWYNPNWYA